MTIDELLAELEKTKKDLSNLRYAASDAYRIIQSLDSIVLREACEKADVRMDKFLLYTMKQLKE